MKLLFKNNVVGLITQQVLPGESTIQVTSAFAADLPPSDINNTIFLVTLEDATQPAGWQHETCRVNSWSSTTLNVTRDYDGDIEEVNGGTPNDGGTFELATTDISIRLTAKNLVTAFLNKDPDVTLATNVRLVIDPADGLVTVSAEDPRTLWQQFTATDDQTVFVYSGDDLTAPGIDEYVYINGVRQFINRGDYTLTPNGPDTNVTFQDGGQDEGLLEGTQVDIGAFKI